MEDFEGKIRGWSTEVSTRKRSRKNVLGPAVQGKFRGHEDQASFRLNFRTMVRVWWWSNRQGHRYVDREDLVCSGQGDPYNQRKNIKIKDHVLA